MFKLGMMGNSGSSGAFVIQVPTFSQSSVGTLATLTPPTGETWAGGTFVDSSTGITWSLTSGGALTADLSNYAVVPVGEQVRYTLTFLTTSGRSVKVKGKVSGTREQVAFGEPWESTRFGTDLATWRFEDGTDEDVIFTKINGSAVTRTDGVKGVARLVNPTAGVSIARIDSTETQNLWDFKFTLTPEGRALSVTYAGGAPLQIVLPSQTGSCRAYWGVNLDANEQYLGVTDNAGSWTGNEVDAAIPGYSPQIMSRISVMDSFETFPTVQGEVKGIGALATIEEDEDGALIVYGLILIPRGLITADALRLQANDLPEASGRPTSTETLSSLIDNFVAGGSALSVDITGSVTGGLAPLTWAAVTLPSGLSLSSAGLLTGAVPQPGSYEVTVRATDARGLSVTVSAAMATAPAQVSSAWSIYDMRTDVGDTAGIRLTSVTNLGSESRLEARIGTGGTYGSPVDLGPVAVSTLVFLGGFPVSTARDVQLRAVHPTGGAGAWSASKSITTAPGTATRISVYTGSVPGFQRDSANLSGATWVAAESTATLAFARFRAETAVSTTVNMPSVTGGAAFSSFTIGSNGGMTYTGDSDVVDGASANETAVVIRRRNAQSLVGLQSSVAATASRILNDADGTAYPASPTFSTVGRKTTGATAGNVDFNFTDAAAFGARLIAGATYNFSVRCNFSTASDVIFSVRDNTANANVGTPTTVNTGTGVVTLTGAVTIPSGVLANPEKLALRIRFDTPTSVGVFDQITLTGDIIDRQDVAVQLIGAATPVPGVIDQANWSFTNPGSGGNLELSILSAPSQGGSPITSYQYRLDGGSAVTLGSGSALGARTISGLTVGQVYSAEVRAVNSVGAGPWSSAKTAVPLVSVPPIYADANAQGLSLISNSTNPRASTWVTSGVTRTDVFWGTDQPTQLEGNGSGSSRLSSPVTSLASGVVYSVSGILRQGSSPNARIFIDQNTGSYIRGTVPFSGGSSAIDTSGSVAGTLSGVTLTNVGNGFYRLSGSFTPSTTGGYRFGFGPSGSDTVTFFGGAISRSGVQTSIISRELTEPDISDGFFLAGPNIIVAKYRDSTFNRGNIRAAASLAEAASRVDARTYVVKLNQDPTKVGTGQLPERAPRLSDNFFKRRGIAPGLTNHASGEWGNYAFEVNTLPLGSYLVNVIPEIHDPTKWTVTVDVAGTPTNIVPTFIYRLSYPEDKADVVPGAAGSGPETAGKSNQFTYLHRIALVLPTGTNLLGKQITLTAPASRTGIANSNWGQVLGPTTLTQSSYSDAVQVRQLGYDTRADKIAVYGMWLGGRTEGTPGTREAPAGATKLPYSSGSTDGDITTPKARLVKVSDGLPVDGAFGVWTDMTPERTVSGNPAETLQTYGSNSHTTGAAIWHFDFSDFDEPGEYRVEVLSVGSSRPFTIATDIAQQQLVMHMAAYTRMRRDIDLSSEVWGSNNSTVEGAGTPLTFPGRQPAYTTDIDYTRMSDAPWTNPRAPTSEKFAKQFGRVNGVDTTESARYITAQPTATGTGGTLRLTLSRPHGLSPATPGQEPVWLANIVTAGNTNNSPTFVPPCRSLWGRKFKVFPVSGQASQIDITEVDGSIVTLAGNDTAYNPSTTSTIRGLIGPFEQPVYGGRDANDEMTRPLNLRGVLSMCVASLAYPAINGLTFDVPDRRGAGMTRTLRQLVNTVGTKTYTIPDNVPDILIESSWWVDHFRDLQLASGAVRGGVEHSRFWNHGGRQDWRREDHVAFIYAADPYSSYAYAASAAMLACALKAQAPNATEMIDDYTDTALAAYNWAEANVGTFSWPVQTDVGNANRHPETDCVRLAARVALWGLGVSGLEASINSSSTSDAAGARGLGGSGAPVVYAVPSTPTVWPSVIAYYAIVARGLRTVTEAAPLASVMSARRNLIRSRANTTGLKLFNGTSVISSESGVSPASGDTSQSVAMPFYSADRVLLGLLLHVTGADTAWLTTRPSGVSTPTNGENAKRIASHDHNWLYGMNQSGHTLIAGRGNQPQNNSRAQWPGQVNGHPTDVSPYGPQSKKDIFDQASGSSTNSSQFYWRDQSYVRVYPSPIDIPLGGMPATGSIITASQEFGPHNSMRTAFEGALALWIILELIL